MHKQKAPIYKFSRSKAPKHGKFRRTDIREKPVDFVYSATRTGVHFNSRNNVANFLLIQKFSFLYNL